MQRSLVIAQPEPMNQPSAVELEVGRIAELVRQRRFARGLQASPQALLATVPENRDAAVPARPSAAACCGNCRQPWPPLHDSSACTRASAACTRNVASATWRCARHPRPSRPSCAAVNINPALPVSWSMLEGLYRMTGDADERRDGAAHVATLDKLPPEVVTATALFSDGELGGRRAADPRLPRCSTATTSRRCGCWRASASSATCSMMRSCCSKGCSTWRRTIRPRASSTRRCSSSDTCTRQAQEQARRLLAAEPANRNYRTLCMR